MQTCDVATAHREEIPAEAWNRLSLELEGSTVSPAVAAAEVGGFDAQAAELLGTPPFVEARRLG